MTGNFYFLTQAVVMRMFAHQAIICFVGMSVFYLKKAKQNPKLSISLTCALANFFSRRSRSRSVCCRRLLSSTISPFSDARAAKWSCGDRKKGIQG